ncbi:unnamed protein product [Prorocentrum cordatum]|uniref:Uncharacterized protein n=1 Tax=Prorocentrum cordatum TaxID=2364126 RepID=A0ABN9R4U8_9DINO|nr:unnamed protein product [Polarella glacialis]
MGVLQVPGTDEAVAAFRAKFPKVMEKPRPDYLGTSCTEPELRARFQALGALDGVGRDSALGLVLQEPLLLAMEAESLGATWEALVRVAEGDRLEALRVARRRPQCLLSSAAGFEGKTLREFDAVADAADQFKPVTDTLQSIGPEGVAMGAAALGVAALGALVGKLGGRKAQRGAPDAPSVEGGAEEGLPLQGRPREARRPPA